MSSYTQELAGRIALLHDSAGKLSNAGVQRAQIFQPFHAHPYSLCRATPLPRAIRSRPNGVFQLRCQR